MKKYNKSIMLLFLLMFMQFMIINSHIKRLNKLEQTVNDPYIGIAVVDTLVYTTNNYGVGDNVKFRKSDIRDKTRTEIKISDTWYKEINVIYYPTNEDVIMNDLMRVMKRVMRPLYE